MPKYGGQNRIDFGVHFNTDKSSLTEVQKAFQKLQDIKPTNFKGSVEELREIKLQALKVQAALTKAFNVKLGSLNVQKFNKELKGLNIDKIYTDLTKLGSQGQVAFSKMATSMMTTNLQLKETHSLINSMGTTMMNTIKWGIASSVMNNFTQSVSQAFQYVKSLDSALTDIRIVTGDSTEQMAQFADQANRAAQQLGRSTMDYSKAALTFYQQGLSDEDVATRTQATLKAQNITGAGQEMADYLTAVWNGYKVANEEAELYVDKLAAVADSSASNMSQLAIAMSKVASTANMLGVPVDSLNAQIATIVATTRQAPESVGNALKTIYARINDIATGADDAEISLGNYSSKMAELGINVLDSNGKLRDTGDVIEQIGGKWEGLSREQQIYLARTMAGQRQYNNLLALFENWGKYTDLVNVSMQSQGTTMQKNSRYMDSLAAHMEQLGAAGERVKSAMIDSDSFKGLIDVGTGITNLFANLIESIGGGGTAFLALGGIVTQVFSGVIAREITNFITNLNTARENEKLLQAEIAMTNTLKESDAYKDGSIKASVDVKQEAQKYYDTMSTGQIEAYNGIIKEISAIEEQTIKIKEAKNASDALIESLSGEGKDPKVEIEQLAGSFEELKNKVQNVNLLDEKDFAVAQESFAAFKQQYGNINVSGLDELLSLFERIKDPVNMDIQQLDSLKGKIQEVVDNAQQKVDLVVNAPQINGQLDVLNGKLESLKNKAKDFLQSVDMQNSIKGIVSFAGGLGQVTSAFMSLSNITKIWENNSLTTGQKVLQLFSNLTMSTGMLINGFKQIGKGFDDLSKGIVGLATRIIAARKGETVETIKATAAEIAKSGANQGEALTALQAAAANGSLAASFGTLMLAALPWIALIGGISLAIYGLVKAYNADADAAKRAGQVAHDSAERYNEVKASAEQLYNSINRYKELEDSFSNLTKGSEEWNTALQESNSLVLDLIKKFPQLSDAVQNVHGRLIIDPQALEEAQEKMNHVVQTAKVSSNYLNSKAAEASITSQATDLGRQHAYTSTSSDGETTTSILSSDQVKEVATIFGDFEQGLIDGIKPDQLSKYISEQTNIQQENIDALLQDEQALRQLNTAIQQNTTATELANTQAAANSKELTESSAYKSASDIDKQIMQRLGGQDLAQKQEQIAKTWEDKIASGINKASSTSNDTYEEVLKKLQEIGYDYKKSTQGNPITGSDKNRVLHFDDSEGNDKRMSAEDVASTIAASEALKQLGNSAEDTKNMLANLDTVGDKNAEGIRQLLANNDFSGMTEKEVLGLDADTSAMKKFFKENFEQAGYDSAKEFKEAFIEEQENTKEAFKNVLKGSSEYVKSAFENGLNTEDLSLDAQQGIVESLQKAFNEGGTEAVDQLTGFYDKISDFDGFDKVTEGLDFSTLTASQFKEKLEEAGVATNLTTEELNAYIQAQKGAAAATPEEKYKNIHDVVDRLKRGDIIDPQQQKQLTDAGVELDNFFSKMPDGTMKLKASAEEFYNYANSISLEGFQNQIDELQTRIEGQKGFEESNWSASNNKNNQEKTFQNFSTSALAGSEIQNDKLAAQVAFLQTIPDLGQDINKVIQEIQAGEQVTEERAEAIAKAVEEHREAWEKNKETIGENQDAVEDLEQQMANATPIDQDVDEDKLYALANYIQQLDPDNKGALKISQTLKDDEKAAEDLAEAMLRYDHALQEVNDNYDDWVAALSSNNMQQQAEVGNQLKNVYSDMLDLPFENLSSEFTTSTQNLQLLKQAANGSEDAYRQLQEAAQQDIIAHLDLSDSDLQNFQAKLQNVQGMLNEMNFQDLEVGAKLDDAQFLNELTNMVNAANMTAQQATDYLASMGIDAQITQAKAKSDDKKEITGVDPVWDDEERHFVWQYVGEDGRLHEDDQIVSVPHLTYKPGKKMQINDTKQTTGHTLKVKSARKSSGGAFKFKQSAYGGGNKGNRGSSGGGGSKGGGGKGSSSKPSIAKKNTTKIETKKKTAEKDPYYKNTLALEKQSKVLKKIQDQQKGLVNKDRLKNLQDQNKTLQEQNKLLRQRQSISNNRAEENSTANLRARLQKEFKNIKFDTDGNIADLNRVEKAAVNSYNKAATAANNTFKKAQDDYNKWITQTWNKHSKEWQDNHQHEKDAWDKRIKNAEENAKKAISTAEEEYKKKEDLIKNYQKALQEDQKAYEEYMNNIRQIMQNTFEASKITVDLSLDAGQLERQWQEFENKFIRKIDDDDILSNAAANAREMMSYFNSEELSKTSDEITKLYQDLNSIEEGNWSNILTSELNNDANWKDLLKKGDKEALRDYGKEWLQDRLNELVKQQQESLMEMQDLIDDIKEQYLDMIDQAHDKMEEHIDQYDRINSIIEHNVKLTELLYGDKGYDTLNKYYELQKSNNMATLESLKDQQDFWREQMNNEDIGSDSWKNFKENYEDAMDAVYSKMEDMIDLLTEQFEKKLAAAVDRINNKLTGGLGTDYLDEQWDYLNNYDDYFLDTYNATTGVEDVTRAYQQAIDDAAANPKQQQRLNTLMKDQLKILKEKNKLTEYDLDRAKSMLEVEKARMALEDARNNKTKMRLRRDSQGNYTYQYVADEEKLGDLQQALADAQNDLYNTDKEHYKENLNQLYDTYKDYLEKMRDLVAEYNATQDDQERARIQKRIDLLNASYEEMYASLTEDNKYNIQYLGQSFAEGMHIDMSGLSSEEQWQVLKDNIPWAKSNIQNLADSIIAQGGLIPATKSAIEEFGKAVKETDEAIDQILNTGGTSVDKVTQAVDQNGKAVDENITNEQAFLMKNQQLINACKNDIDKMRELLVGVSSYWEENTENLNKYITALREGQNTLQGLNNSSLKVDNSLPVAQDQLNALTEDSNWTFTGNIVNDAATLRTNLNDLLDRYNEYIQAMVSQTAQLDTGGFTGDFTDGDAKLAFLHSKELVLNPVDTENILAAVAMVRDITARMNVQTQLNNLSASTGQLLNNLAENSTLLDQQVHIDANFPNVTQHTQIEEAFNNLVNMAAMRASEYRD